MTGNPEPRCVWDARALLGEGPVWDPDEGVLNWVDIKGKALHRYRPADGGRASLSVPSEIGCIALRQGGGLVAALRTGFVFIGLPAGAVIPLSDPEAHLPGNRFNDGKCDRNGRFFAGTMDDACQAPTGSLYRLDPGGETTRLISGYAVCNGPAWSPDGGTLYFSDSAARLIHAFDFDAAGGSLANGRVFARVPEDAGYPDGLTVDAEGFLWSAHWDGWRLTRYAPDGRIDRVIPLPVRRPTSCAFGGPGLDRLYVTSASIDLTPDELAGNPLAGGLFELDAGVAGLPEPRFAG